MKPITKQERWLYTATSTRSRRKVKRLTSKARRRKLKEGIIW